MPFQHHISFTVRTIPHRRPILDNIAPDDTDADTGRDVMKSDWVTSIRIVFWVYTHWQTLGLTRSVSCKKYHYVLSSDITGLRLRLDCESFIIKGATVSRCIDLQNHWYTGNRPRCRCPSAWCLNSKCAYYRHTPVIRKQTFSSFASSRPTSPRAACTVACIHNYSNRSGKQPDVCDKEWQLAVYRWDDGGLAVFADSSTNRSARCHVSLWCPRSVTRR